MKKVSLLMVLITALSLGCSLVSPSVDGTLVLSLSTQGLLRTKTIEPTLDMVVDHYDVSALGPGGTSFEQLGVTDTTVVQASLVPGEWTITVEAYNGDSPPTLIGVGSATVIIAAGEVLSESITVDPVGGGGQLDVTIEWPAGVLINPSVVGTLTPSGGSSTALTFTNAGDGLSANYLSPGPTDAAALQDGYYALVLNLSTDRSDGSGSDVVWGTVDAVRIVAGEISETTFVLVEDVNRGGLELNLDLQLDNPIVISISGIPGTVQQNEDVIATAEPAGLHSYQWFLDGLSIGNGNPFTFSTDVGGHHWLSVMVTSGEVMSSASVAFDVPSIPVNVIRFDDAYALNGQGSDLDLFYSSWGVNFDNLNGYGVVGGDGNGDPGNWDMEGTNGSALWGIWQGYHSVAFDAPVSFVSLDFCRSHWDLSPLTVYAYNGGTLVGSSTFSLIGAYDTETVTFQGPIDLIDWNEDATFGVDNIQYIN